MATPRILHMLTPLKHMSPFDVNMGLDAGFDHAIPYTNVTVEDVYGLVQDAIFSRGPEGIKRTAMFIGGKRAIEAVQHRDKRLDGIDKSVVAEIRLLFGGTLAGVIEICLHTRQTVNECVPFGAKLFHLRDVFGVRFHPSAL